MPDGITANAGGREYASSGARMIPPIPAQNRTGARAFALVMRWLVRIAALLTAAVLIFLIGYILVMGIPNLKPSLFEWTYNSENVSLVPSLINTVLMTAFSLSHRHAAGHLCRRLAGRIRQARQQAGQGGARHHPRRCRASRPSCSACSACCSLSPSCTGATA